MTNPRFRTLYPNLLDAPLPPHDDFWIAVQCGDWIQDYVTKDGEYLPDGAVYLPAIG
jgi:hypothetical protein